MRTELFTKGQKNRVRGTLKIKSFPQKRPVRGRQKIRHPRKTLFGGEHIKIDFPAMNGVVRGTLNFSHPRSAGKTLYINI